jgi:hypothetical protein
MVDLGGLSVKEMSQGLKDALLDVLMQRTALPNAANPLATLQDILNLGGGGGGGGGGGAALQKADVGPLTNSTSSLTYVVVPGSAINLNLDSARVVVLNAWANFVQNSDRTHGQIAIRVTSPGPVVADYDGGRCEGGSDFDKGHASITRAINLVAGVHTIELLHRQDRGGAFISDMTAAFLTAVYAVPSPARAANLVIDEVQDTNQFNTQSNTFVVVPGTQVNFNLDEGRTVLFIADGTLRNTGVENVNAILGLKIDGVDYPLQRWKSLSTAPDEFGKMALFKSLPLAAGAHTAEIIARTDPAMVNPNTWFIDGSADSPTTLRALYVEPIFGIGKLANSQATVTVGFSTSSSIFVPVPGSAIGVTLKNPQNVTFQAFATAKDDPLLNTDAIIGIRVNGTDYPGSRARIAAASLDKGALIAEITLALPPGVHAAEIVLRAPSGPADPAIMENTLFTPARLVALYTSPESFPQTLGYVKATPLVLGNHGGAGAVPGTQLTFNLSAAQDVLIHAQSAGVYGNVLGGQSKAYLRHTDPLLVVTDYRIGETFESDGGDFVAGSSQCTGSFILNLQPGSHTFELVAGGNTSIFAPMQVHAIAQEPI